MKNNSQNHEQFPKVLILCLIHNILKFGRKEDIVDLIKSVNNLNYPQFDFLLIDNGSSDNTIDFLANNYPEIKKIQTANNLGFSGGFNYGINYCEKQFQNIKYFFLLNDDIVLEPDSLRKMIEIAEKSDEIGICSPIEYVYEISDKIISLGAKKFYPFLSIGVVVRDLSETKIPYYQVYSVNFSAVLIKAKTFTTIGYFDEDYFYGFEDFDFSLRAKRKGIKSVIVTEAKFWHKHKLGHYNIDFENGRKKRHIITRAIRIIRTDIPAPYIYYPCRNRLLFVKKNTNYISFLIFMVIWLFCFLPVRIIYLIIKKRSDLIHIMFLGIKDFFIGKYGKGSI